MASKQVSICVAMMLFATGAAAADPLGDARAAIGRHDYPAALGALRQVLATGKPGDRTAAKNLLAKVAEDGSASSMSHGDDESAVRMLVDVANLIAPDPRSTGLNARAKQLLHALYGKATKQKGYDRALWAVTTSAADFPADPPLAPEGAVESLRVGAAAIAIRTASPRQAYGIVQGLLAAKVPPTSIDLGGLDRAGVAVAYARTFQDAGWYAQAAAVAGDALAVGDLPPAGARTLTAFRATALAARADACLAFGNRAMAVAAVSDFTAAGIADADKLGRLKGALAKLDASPPDPAPSIGLPPAVVIPPGPTTQSVIPTTLPATAPTAATRPTTPAAYVPFQDMPDAPGASATTRVAKTNLPTTRAIVPDAPAPLDPLPLPCAVPASGEQMWVDGGSGYTLAGGTVRIGNCKAEHGGTWAKGDVHVVAGFVLEDRTVNASSGVLRLQGTADRPVVVRHVRFNCDYTAAVEARFTLFQDCTFAKSGGWHWNGGVNTKWTLVDCLLVNCRFNNLNGPDMGIDLTRCGLASTPLPPRVWRNRPQMSDDAMQGYRGEWSHVADCDFDDCAIATSAVWMCVACNFRDCRATDPASFASKTPLAVTLGVADDEQPFYDALVAGTRQAAGAGRVSYARQATPFTRPNGPSPLWHLAPAVPR